MVSNARFSAAVHKASKIVGRQADCVTNDAIALMRSRAVLTSKTLEQVAADVNAGRKGFAIGS
jgi:phage-related minor tail protein